MRKWIVVLLLLLFNLGLFGDNNRYKTYDMMIRDLKNVTTFGYRELSQSLSSAINTVGISYYIENKNCFMIMGKGFFKVYDKRRKRYLYTRYGFFEKVKDVFVTVEGYVLVTKIKIKIEKSHGITLEDMLFKSLKDSGSKIDRASFLKRPVFIYGEKFYFNKKTLNAREIFSCNLYLPKGENDFKLTQNRRYFKFKSCRVIKNVEVSSCLLEVSTVSPVKILPEMVIILESELKNNVKNNYRIIKKIKILRLLLKNYKNALSNNNSLYLFEGFLPQLKIYLPYLEKD